MRKLFFCLILILWFHSLYGQQKKTTIAVLDFQSKGSLEKIEVYTLTNRFRGLLQKTNAFNVIEAEKMIEILKLKDFNVSESCNTTECAIQMGKLLDVEAMVTGNVGKLGDTYTIDARLINVETGAIIKSAAQDYEGKVDGLLSVLKKVADAMADNSYKTKAGINLTETTSTSKHDNKKLWYFIGGAVIIGGATAVLLSGGNNKRITRIPDMDLPPIN